MQTLTPTCVKRRSVAAGGLMQGFDGVVWGVVALQVRPILIVGIHCWLPHQDVLIKACG